MQRREAKIGLRDRKRHRRPKERNDAGENTHRNGLFRLGPGIRGSVGLDGGGCSPAKLVSNAGTGNFLKISGQNRLLEDQRPLVIGNSIVIQSSYSSIQALSCYSAKQALETQKQVA